VLTGTATGNEEGGGRENLSALEGRAVSWPLDVEQAHTIVRGSQAAESMRMPFDVAVGSAETTWVPPPPPPNTHTLSFPLSHILSVSNLHFYIFSWR